MKHIIALSLLTFVIACSEENKFKGGIASADAEVAVVPEKVVIEASKITKTLDLKTSATRAPIDMVWVVDNSGSMDAEVAQVRSNIQKFVSTIQSTADLQLSVISNEDPRFGLQFDSMSMPSNFVQLKTYVGSYNAMTILAAALCDPASTEANSNIVTKVCGKDVVSTIENKGQPRGFLTPQALENSDLQATAVAGKLKTRMRAESTKVFVFVTDDTAGGGVDGTNFMTFANTALASSEAKAISAHVYAFAGLAKSDTCKIENVGQSYIDVAKATGGAVFDICELDWSQNFAKLTENVIKLTSRNFQIPPTIKALKAVKINGKKLAAAEYSFKGGKLVIADSVALNEKDEVEVDYEVDAPATKKN